MRGQKRKEPPGFDALIEAERRAREGTGFSTELVDLRLAVFRKLDKRAKRAEDERQQIARAESDAASAKVGGSPVASICDGGGAGSDATRATEKRSCVAAWKASVGAI